MSDEIVLPADVYDALELSALVYGGIGAGEFRDSDTGVPMCVIGHAYDLGCREELRPSELHVGDNDGAVHAINRRRNRARDTRVPFADWCLELHVVRGD